VSDSPIQAKYDRRQFAMLVSDLKRLNKNANRQLRAESKQIATQIMKPEFDRQAERVPHWGQALPRSVFVVSDRIPSVKIGGRRPLVSGGATGIDLRNPTYSGQGRESPAPFTATGWMRKASGVYKDEAFDAWSKVVEKICRKFNAGGFN